MRRGEHLLAAGAAHDGGARRGPISATGERSALLVYDSDCGFCRWTVGKVLAWDRRLCLTPLALQADEARGLLAALDHRARMDSWHLIGDDRHVRSGGAAVGPLLRLLPGGRAAGTMAERSGSLTGRAYRSVAGRRALLGRLVPASAKRRADERIARREKGVAV